MSSDPILQIIQAARKETYPTGIDINSIDPQTGDTALHVLIRQNEFIAADHLLSHGSIDVNIENKNGETPLYLLQVTDWSQVSRSRYIDYHSVEYKLRQLKAFIGSKKVEDNDPSLRLFPDVEEPSKIRLSAKARATIIGAAVGIVFGALLSVATFGALPALAGAIGLGIAATTAISAGIFSIIGAALGNRIQNFIDNRKLSYELDNCFSSSSKRNPHFSVGNKSTLLPSGGPTSGTGVDGSREADGPDQSPPSSPRPKTS